MKLIKIFLISAILMVSAVTSHNTAAGTGYLTRTFGSLSEAGRFCGLGGITCYGSPQLVDFTNWIVYYTPNIVPDPGDDRI